MKNLLNFISFEALNERILIPPDEDRRLKDEVLPKIKEILADQSRWTSADSLNDYLKSESKYKEDKIHSIPFDYKLASGEEATVRFLVLITLEGYYAAFSPGEGENLKDNLIFISAGVSDRVKSPDGERKLFSAMKHKLIHAKDPGLNQYKYSNFDLPRKREEYREKYFKTKPEGIAFGGQFLEEIRDRTREFVRGGLTEEKVKTLNSVLNDLANGFTDPLDLSPETIEFLGYSEDISLAKTWEEKFPSRSRRFSWPLAFQKPLTPFFPKEIDSGQIFPEPPRWKGSGNALNPLKSLRDQENLEFKKFQKKFYQEIIRIAAEINSDLSAKYPQIKGRIKISSSQP